MSRTNMTPDAVENGQGGRVNVAKLLPFLAVFGFAFLLVIVALVLAMGLRGDVDRLEHKAREATKTRKLLGEDIAALRELLTQPAEAAPQPTPVAQEASEPPVIAASPALPARSLAIPVGRRSPPYPAAAPAQNAAAPRCVFRAGDAQALADCIERQQGAIEAMQTRYR